MTLPAVYLPELEMRYVPRMEVLPTRKFWRVKHDPERPGCVRQIVLDKGTRPEVYRFSPDHATVLNCTWQKLWKDLNPALSGEKWSSLLGNALAWTNNTGFPGHVPLS